MELGDSTSHRHRRFASCSISERYLDDSKCNCHRKCNYHDESAKVQNIVDQILRHDACGELNVSDEAAHSFANLCTLSNYISRLLW